jgi:hypothetical protein
MRYLSFLLLVTFCVSGCVSNGQGVLAQALNNSLSPDVDPAICQTMKGQPRQVFNDFAAQHKLQYSGILTAIGELYPQVQLYVRGNWRAAVAFETVLKGQNAQGQNVYEILSDPARPLIYLECWKSTDPIPPGRKEFIGVKM